MTGFSPPSTGTSSSTPDDRAFLKAVVSGIVRLLIRRGLWEPGHVGPQLDLEDDAPPFAPRQIVAERLTDRAEVFNVLNGKSHRINRSCPLPA